MFWELFTSSVGKPREREGDTEKMAQAMIEERKRYLTEQALNANNVKVQKNKRRMKEEKQSSAPGKKKAKAKLPKSTVEKTVKRKAKSNGPAALIPAKVSVVPTEEMKALFDSVTESPLISSKIAG